MIEIQFCGISRIQKRMFERMWDIHYVNNVASVRRILPFEFLLISPTGSTGSERDKYNNKDKNSSITRCISLVNKSLLYRVIVTMTKPPK